MYEIFCDSLQEGIWFKNLHSCFSDADFAVIPNSKREQAMLGLDRVLIYDRPDIILKHDGQIILVLERTVEVPSGTMSANGLGVLLPPRSSGSPLSILVHTRHTSTAATQRAPDT